MFVRKYSSCHKILMCLFVKYFCRAIQQYCLRLTLGLTPTWSIWSNSNTPKIGGIGVGSGAQKPAIPPKQCKIGPRLLWRSNRKSHTHFRLVSKSMTLDDLARPKRHSRRNKKVLRSQSEKFLSILSAAKCKPMILVSRNKRSSKVPIANWYQSKARMRFPVSLSSSVLHHFWDKATYWLKIAYFSYPSLIRRPRSVCSLWNFAVKLTVRKLESWGCPPVKTAWL